MFNLIKENLFIVLATVFLGGALAFSFNAYGQSTGDCETCAGRTAPENTATCYDVNAGSALCTVFMNGCDDVGGCENGETEFEEA